MYNLLKWFSTLLFISAPVLFISSIWFGDFRYTWTGLFNVFFSIVSAGVADMYKVSRDKDL